MYLHGLQSVLQEKYIGGHLAGTWRALAGIGGIFSLPPSHSQGRRNSFGGKSTLLEKQEEHRELAAVGGLLS